MDRSNVSNSTLATILFFVLIIAVAQVLTLDRVARIDDKLQQLINTRIQTERKPITP